MRYTIFPFLFFIFILSSCNLEEIANSKDVNPDTIYSSYNVQYKEGNQEVTCTAKFRFGGPQGTTLVLNDSSRVTLDNESIAVDSSKYSGAFYMIKKPFVKFTGNHVWAFTDVNGKVYKESFSLKSVTLAERIPASIKRSGLDLKFNGLVNGDSIFITIADTSKNISTDKKYFVRNGSVQIPETTVKELKPGVIELNFYVKNVVALKNSTKEGGDLTQTYVLKTVTTKLSE